MKWSQMKRVISLTLCVLMVLALLPTSSLAEDAVPATATSTPVEATPDVSEATPTADATVSDNSADTATPTPAPSDAAEATPTPSETPTQDIIPDGLPTYVVNFVIDGQTIGNMQKTVTQGDLVPAPSIPAVPDSEAYVGQVFRYWYEKAGQAYDFNTPVTSDLVLYAEFGQAAEAPVTGDEPVVADEGLMFSAFSMAGGIIPASTPLWTYTFVVNSATVATKIVANGDTLDAPEVPTAPVGQKFSGWYTASNTLFDSFGTQTVTVDGATTLTAKFETAYNVFFYNQFGSITETRTPDSSNIVSTATVTSLKLASDEALVGWSLTSGGTTDVGASVTVNGANINLYPIIKKVVWITFDSAGGTYISPMYIQPNTALTQAAVNTYIATQNGGSSAIVKTGYTFTSWSGFTFGTTPTANVTLTASWTPQIVGYTVLFWQQAVVGDTYVVVAADTDTTRTITAGTSVSPTTGDAAKGYKGFNYNATKSVAVTVNGDGSTLLNIYYDRQTWTVNWLMRTKNTNNTFNNNGTYYNWVTKTGRYGSKISYWPVASEISSYYSGGMSGYTHTGWMQNSESSNTKLSYLEIYDDGGTQLFYSGVLNLYAQYTNQGITTDTFNHIRQNLDLTWPTTPYVTAYGYNVSNFGINNRFEGFTAAYYNTDTNSTWQTAVAGSTSVDLNSINTLNIRHTRNSYNLTVRNFNTQLSTTSILYEKPLSSYQPAQPSRPSGIPSDYVWGGWYTTQEGFAGSEMSWTSTMPAHDLIIYGVWKEPAFTGIAHSVSFGTAGGTTVDLGSISYGGTISASALAAAQAAAIANKPNPTDTFGGWLIMKNGSLILFNSSMQIYENVVLYPVWISTLNFSVTYNLGEATGTVPVDSLTYVNGSQAQVKSYTAGTVTPPTDKVFIGWRSSVDSKIYYPNSNVTITGNTTMTAVWAYSSVNVTITYNGNGGATSGGTTTFTGGAINNTYHTVQGNSFLYTGKLFVGWNTAANGSGTYYYPGDSVLLGTSVASAPGTLYAIWQDQTFLVSVTANPTAGVTAKSGAGTYVYGTNTNVTWTLATGYEITSVTDNTFTIPASSYTGNHYTLSGIMADHAIVINTQKTLFALTYNGNGGTAGSNTSYSSTKTIGTSFTVDSNTFTRAGYYFLGWSTNAAATTADAAYAPGTTVVMPGSDLTLYAVWAPKMALTLTANNATQNYDGTVKSVSGMTPSISGLTIENATASASGTNPGVYATSFTNQAGLVLKSGGVDVTNRYTVTWAAGALTINPQVTYRASANNALLGTEWVAYGTGDATYNVTPPQSISVSGTNYYWLGTYSPATAIDLTANTTIYASYSQNKTLVITAGSASYVYNGTTRSVTTGTVNVSGVTVTGYTVSGSGTNVGTYTTSVTLGTVKIMSGATDVTYQYDVSTVNGLLTITPATTTATSAGYTGKYDGVAHGITVTPTASGSTIRYSLTNSTNPADYTLSASPTATDATAGTTVYFVVTNPNYNPVFGNEVVTINKRVVALTTSDATQMYNGTALTNPAWSYNSTGNDGFVAGQGFATSAANGTITNVGTANNTFTYTLTAATKAANYTVSVTEGKLTITASNDLSVSATDVTKKYDGTAYGVTASANVPTSTTIRYSLTNSTNPADYTLTTSPTATHVDENKTVYFVATNANYDPAFGSAKVTITPRAITATAATDTKVYSGTPLTNATVTLSGDGFLAGEGFATSPTANGTITNVGSVTNPVVAGTLNASTQAHDYTITPVAGSLSVTAKTLTVKADDQQIAYPADRPANAALTYTLVSGNVSGETPAYNGVLGYDSALAADPLTPNTYTNAIVGGTLALKNSGTFLASNYALTVLPGNLKVVNGGFTVDLTGGSWTYNGNPHGTTLTGTNSGDTVEYFVPNGSGGWTSTGSTPPTVTNVSDGPLTVKVVVTRPGYDPAEDTTTLTINPANTTASSDGYTGTYDNLPHGITVTPAISGSTVKYSLTNSTNPADYTLTTSPTATDATAGTTVYFVVTNPNYNPVFGNEQIVINKRVVALTTSSATKEYDGTALTNPAWSYNSTGNDGFVTGQGFATSAANGTITNVGTANNTFAYTLTAATSASNYTVSVTEGKLTITASNDLSVSATDVTKMYDGTAYGVSASANVPGNTTIRYSLTNSTDPADYTLTTSPTATHVDENKTVYFVATNANYDPAFGSAKVTITPRAITATAATETQTYNGSALTNSTVTLTGDGFLSGEGFATNPTANGTITNVGSVTNPVVAGTLNASTAAHDYTITPVAGSLSVTAKTLTVQADDQQIAYPADRPANAALTYTLVSGNVSGETPAYNGVLGYDSALAADPLTPNTYTDAIVGGTLTLKNNGTFTASNYALTVLPGNLKVINGGFTVDLTGGSWTYNGNPHGTTLTGTNSGDTVEYFVPNGSGGWTSTGSTPPTVTNVSDGPLTVKVVVTRPGYDPAEDTTTLTINPANTTASSDGYTGTYDNLPHGITVTPAITTDSVVKYSTTNSTDPADYTLSASPTATDATAGTTVYFVVTNPNYNPVFGNEVVTINKRVVALTTSNATQMYNGTALTNPAWSYNSTGNDGFVAGQGFATSAANGTITNVGTANNTFAYTLTAATKAANYTVDVTMGKLTITASNDLSVSATDVTHKYDGTAYGVSASANVPAGTTIRYSLTNSTNPADYTLTTSPTATHVDENKTVYFVATNANYDPAFGSAKVTITPRAITATAATDTKVYSGTPLTNATVTLTGDSFLSGEGFATSPTANGTITNVGSVTNPVVAGTLNASTAAHDYTITPVAGSLSVTAKTLTVQADNQQIAYPADRPANAALTYTLVSGNVSGETPAYNGVLGYDSALAADPLTPNTYTNAIVGGTLALKNSGTFTASNYALTVLPGDLKVVNGGFTVDLTGGSWTYNGNPHGTTITGTNSGDTVEYFVPNGSGGWTSTGSTPPTVTNVSDGPLTVKVVVTRPGYDPAEDTTTLTINPANTTASSDGYTGTYDNLPHGITVTPAISGSTIRYSLTNSTNPADYTLGASPTATDATAGTTVYFVVTNPNYNPVFGNEVVTINKRVVALTTATATKEYDGTALTNVAWSYNSTGNDGFVAGQGFATAAANGTITNVGTANNTFAYTLTSATKAANYTVSVTEGKLTITASNDLSVSATDVTQKYDGTAYGVSASANVPAGTTIRYSLTNSTNPADYTLTTSPTATHVDENKTVYFVATNANYDPAFGSAKVTITPRAITATAATETQTYNGSALTNSAVTLTGDSFLSGEGFATSPTASGTITNVGSVTNPVVAGTLNASTAAHDYTITPVAGSLSVTAKTLTVQADDQQIAYPADRPANSALTYTLVSGNVSGETPAYNGVLGYDSALASDPLTPNTYTDAIVGGTLALKNNGTFTASNYALTVLPGNLNVINGGFTVDLTGGSWTYNGNPHGTSLTGTNSGDTVEYFVPNGSGGWTSTGSTPPTVTNVSDGPLTVKVVVTRPGYDPAEDTTTLTINPANTTASSNGYTGTYDNLAHGITVTPAIEGSTVKYSLTNSTNPADYTLSASPTATDATAGTTVYFVVTNPNYNPVFGNEQIVINKRVVALTTATATKEYDGTALTNVAWSYNSTGNDGFVAGQGFATSAANGTITNVGTANNTFAYTLTSATKAANYTVDVTMGKLTITASNDLTVSATDVTKKYDGTAYGVTASANVPGNTTIRYSLTNSTNPADYTLTTSPMATHVDENKTVYFVATNANYDPAFGSAKVTITPRAITATAATDTQTYNGSALTNATVTLTGDGFLSGEGFATNPTASGTITNVGSVTNPVVAGTLNASTQAHDYTITPVAGSLSVTAKTLTVQADDQQIAYPADRPANSLLTYTLVSGNVSGETPAYNGVLGYDSALAADPLTPNTYTAAIVGGTMALKNNGTFTASNYALTVLPGDLNVVNGGFTVDLTGGSWTYNGNPHGTTLTGTNSGDTVEYFVPNGSGGWTSTGSTPPTVTNVSDGPLTVKVVVTRPGYDPAEDTTTLTINPANTTASSDGYTGTYENLPHGITVTPAIEGSTVKYSLTNSTNPADYTLTTSPTATDATVGTTVYFVVTNPNYNPVFGNEQIVINKRVVALTTSSATKEYDGTALTNVAWSYNSTGNDGFVTGQGFATSAANGTITNVGTANNTFAYTLTSATKAANYTVSVTEGKLTITASNDLSVSATDVTQKYDGTAYGVSASANVPAGTTIRYSLTNSTNPADYTLTTSPTATHVDENKTVYFVATNANYDPAFGSAKVTITPRAITATAATETQTYNGSALTNSAVTLTGDSFLSGEGFATSPTASGTITNVGSVTNPVVAGTLNASTAAHDYTITPVAGSLSVTAKTLTVQADDQQIAYPADRPANSALTYTLVSGNVSGETPAYNGVLGYDSALASDPLTPNTYTDAIVGGTLALKNNGTFTASNYALTVLPGNLNVINGGFTVDLTGGSWTYNGNPHGTTITGTNSGDTVEYFVPNGSGGWTSTGSTPPTVTNVSDGPLTVKVVVTRPGYDPAEDTTTLTINPANTTASSDGYTGTYDNLPHGITVTPAITTDSVVKYSTTNSTDPADYTLTTSPTATDATAGTTVYFVVTNPNYNPVFGNEQIVINKRVVALTTSDATQMYNGNPLTNPAWSYNSTGNDGFVAGQGFATSAANGTITNVGTANNTFAYTLTSETKAANYTVSVTEGKLTITASNDLSVSATDVTKKYDGTAYGVTASANVPAGTTIRYSLTNSTNPADYTLTTSPTATHVDENKTVYYVATNANYEPAFGSAKVTITPRAITATAATDTQTYNGSALTNSTVTLTGDGFLSGEGFATIPTANGTITNVGSVTNPVVAGTLNASTQAHDYTITPVAGSLSVTAKTLTVQADNQQIAYPADRPANAALTYTLVSGNVSGETPAYNGTLGYDSALASDPLTPNTYTNAIVGGTLALKNNGTFTASNYALTVLPGNLKVVNGGFTVDLTGGSWTYNGNPHGTTITGTNSGDTVEYFISDGAGGWTSTGSTPPTVTNVSDGPLTVKVVVTRPGYDPAEDTTTLTINPANTTASSDGYTGTYDNLPHGITVTPAIEGSTVKYSLTNSTNPADYTLSASPTATDATAGTTVYFVVTNPNYNPVFGNEVVTINKRVVALTTSDATQMYNGNPLTNPAWSYNSTGNDGFVAGQGFATSAANGTITNVGTANNTFSYTLTSETKAANYTVDVTMGKLTITASNDLSVSATDVTQKYDGTAYGVSASANVPTGTTIRYSLTNSTNPADYTLTTSPVVKNVSESKTIYFVATNPNYLPTYGSASVTVTPRDVVVDTNDATKVYDSLPLTANGWSIDTASDGFVGTEGFATTTNTGTITNVGTTDNGFTYTLKSNTLSGNYNISAVPGTLSVTPRTVMIAAVDTDKNYGSADPVFAYSVPTGTITGTTYYPILAADLAGITVTVHRTGSDSSVGTYVGELVPSVVATQAVLKNYIFSTQTADLTIDPQVVYNLNTTDTVNGFPGTQWVSLGSDATVATADGVKRPGYHLVGWQDAATGDPIALGGTIPAIGQNYTLNAVWEITLYDVIYETGTLDKVDYMPANVVANTYNTALTVSNNIPYHSGYGFLYWITTGIDGTETHLTPGDAFNMPDGNLTLTAAWDPRSSPVYYHANGANGGTVEGGRFFTDDLATVSGNMFSRPGYRFLGWSEKSATAGVSSQPGTTFVMPPRQVNFYAQWEKLAYTVTYIVSGGTGALDGNTPYAVYTGLGYGDAMPVPSNPTLSGYNFDGWTTAIPSTVPEGGLVIYGSMTLQTTPVNPEKVPDEKTPLAGGPTWALLNLILTIATALASILMLIGLIGKKKEEEEGVVVRETEKHGFTRVLTLLPGIGAIIAFILTENMSNPMVFTDRWTLLMVIITLVQLVLVIFGAKKDKEPVTEKMDDALTGK